MLWSSVLPVNSVYGILWKLLLCCWPLLWPLLAAAAAAPLLLAAAAAAAAVPGWSPAAPTAGHGPPRKPVSTIVVSTIVVKLTLSKL